MDERFNELKKRFEELLNTDISHDELGTANGYHEAEDSKNNACQYSLSLIYKINTLGEHINSAIIDDAYKQLNSTANILTSLKDQIEQTVAQGIHNNNFPNQRNSQIQNVEVQSLTIKKQTNPIELALRVVELEQKVGSDEQLDELSKKLKEQLKKAEKAAKDASNISEVLRNQAAEKGVDTARGAFQILSDDHKKRENLWFIAFIASSVVFICVIYYIFQHEVSFDNIPQVVYEVFKRLLLLSTAGLAIKITLTIYNLERNLRIIYEHRSTSLKQFEIFEKAIADEVEAKNQLRLDIAKYVFSDPDTGYRGTSSNDININPVLTTVEKIVSKSEKP